MVQISVFWVFANTQAFACAELERWIET